MAINVLVLCPSKTDSTSFYRGMGPISQLRRKYGEKFNFIMADGMNINWAILGMIDVLFMQRPFSGAHVQIMDMAKENLVPVWLDYDDDLFNVPTDNPTYGNYGAEDTKRNIAKMISMANHVTVSTWQLKENLSKLNQNITVVPNAFNEHLFRYRDIDHAEKKKIFLWRGSETHVRDVMTYADILSKKLASDSQWVWTFLGMNPWMLRDVNPSKLVNYQALDVIEYFRTIHRLQPGIIHVPLHDSMFNRCKSNIAMIEGAFAGAACIAPEWQEWQHPGVITYKGREEYEAAIDAVERGDVDLVALNKLTWEYVTDCLLLDHVNIVRARIIQELHGEK